MAPRGRVAIVTGSSRGIGRAIAQAFAREGCAVVVNAARSIAEARAVADAISAGGGRAVAVQADVGDPAQARDLIARALQEYGRIDVLVNNAGIVDRAGLWQIDEAGWSAMMAVHVTGPFFASRAAAEAMRAQGSGAIVNIASMRGIEPGSGPLHYNVSKAAVLMLTKCLARDLAPAGAGERDRAGLHRDGIPRGPDDRGARADQRAGIPWDGSGVPRRSRAPRCFSPPTAPRT